MTIDDWIAAASAELRAVTIVSDRLDAELLLSHTLRQPRTWLHTHGDEIIDTRRLEIANARLDLRRDHVPIAYIIGHKEFYGRRFTVTTATLIPRPESEGIIELLSNLPLPDNARLVDVGTGSGCLGITAKLEHPALDVTLIDIDTHALKVAQKNADDMGVQVTCLKSNLLSSYPYTADAIIANLPYVDETWERSPETDHEPPGALFAADNGLALIKQLIDQCGDKLQTGGYLLIEADRRQHHALTHYAEKHSLSCIVTKGLIIVYQSV